MPLQGVRRGRSGIFTCVAHNSEGDGVSNPITLNVRCKIINPHRVSLHTFPVSQ